MLRNLIYTLIAALLVWAVVAGIQSFFFSQPAKTHDLMNATLEAMKANPQYGDNILDIKLMGPKQYRIDTTGLSDSHSAGRFAYNAMVYLTERNDSLVKTGENEFTILGFQDGQQIFIVTYAHGNDQIPEVTLMGKFEGEKYVPQFKGQSSVNQNSTPKNNTEPSLKTSHSPFGLA
jgi:hypothetical protein